jgi:ribonuclease-3
MSAEWEELEARIGYTFARRELLLRALTHKSLLSDTSSAPFSPQDDNEQLEFLGDSVLGFLASDYLYRTFPSLPEGKLSKLKSHMVSAVHLHAAARSVDLGQFLRLGRGEEKSGGRQKRALLANGFEALIAAVYLDGGLDACRAFVERFLLNGLPVDELGVAVLPTDPKSSLQELAQSRGLPMPRYVMIREHGPEHAKLFVVEVRVGKEYASQAEGSSKKSAGQKAAEQLLETLAAVEPEVSITRAAEV